MEDGYGKRISSRLSAKAPPFRLNRFTAQPTWTSSLTSLDPCDSLLKSLANVNLEEDPLPSASSFGMDSLQGSSFGQHEPGLDCNNYAYETLLEQGKPVKKSKLYDENSGSAIEKCSHLTMGKETPFTSRSPNQVDAGIFSFSAVNSVATPYEFPMSVKCSASMLQSYSQPELPYTTQVSRSPRGNAFPDLESGSSFSPSNPILLKNAEVTGSFAVLHNDSSSKYSSPDIMDLHQILLGEGGEGKKNDHDKSSSYKGNERKCGKAVSSEDSDPLLTVPDPQVTLKKPRDKSSLEHQDAEEAISFSTKLDENDSDVDSPCWRGSLASRQTPLGVSRSLSSHENVQEASYSLNPLAPHFFPRPSKAIVNCYANGYDADDFSSFKKSDSGAVDAVYSFSKENISVDKAGSKSSLSINGLGTQTSININESMREYALLDKSGSDSALSKGVSKLLSTGSKIDVSTVLNMMHDLSSFLVQKCSNDVLLNDHDLIQHTINNLCICIQHRAEGKSPMPDLTVSGTPNFPNKSTEIIKVGCSNMGFQVTNTAPFAVPHENLIDRLDFTERMLDFFPSDSNIGTGKSKDIIQVMGNSVRNSYSTKDEIDPQALVYKKLWLEAEATLRAMKYERCVMQEIGYGMAQSKQK